MSAVTPKNDSIFRLTLDRLLITAVEPNIGPK